MYKTEGYWNVKPKIRRLSFPHRGKFQVDLYDGRSIVMPVSAFPSLKRVPVKEREHWYLMGVGLGIPVLRSSILSRFWATSKTMPMSLHQHMPRQICRLRSNAEIMNKGKMTTEPSPDSPQIKQTILVHLMY